MTTSISGGTPVAPSSPVAGRNANATGSAADLAVATNVAAGLASAVSAALNDALSKGPGGMDPVSLLRLQGTTSALDVWTDAASAAAQVEAVKKKHVAGEI